MSIAATSRSDSTSGTPGGPPELPEFAAKRTPGGPPELPEFAAKRTPGGPPELPEFAAKRIPAVLDLFVLALALPVFVLASLPLAGYAVGGGAWLAQRGIQLAVQRRAAAADDPRTIVGLTAGSMIFRAWIVAGAVFAVGVAGKDEDGLAAAVLAISLFTVYFAVQLILHAFGGEGSR